MMVQGEKSEVHEASGEGAKVRRGAILACVLLIAGVAAYRFLDGLMAMAEPTSTVRPLSSLPMILGGWRGQDVPLDPNIVKIAAEDDHVNRVYSSVGRRRRSLDIYIGFSGGTRRQLSHRPFAGRLFSA